MATSADKYQDALIQHGVELEGVSNSLVQQMVGILNSTDRDLAAELRERAEELGVGSPGIVAEKKAELEEMLAAVLIIRQLGWRDVYKSLTTELVSVAKFEAVFNNDALLEAIAILEVELDVPTAAELRKIVTQQPFQGALLKGWIDRLSADDLARIRSTIVNAVAEEATVDDLVQRVRGTRAQDYTDGALQTGRIALASIIGSALSHTQNSSREEFFAANANVMDGMVWISTLDGRTTKICASLDGQIAPPPGGTLGTLPAGRQALQPPGRRPPAHLGGCRSVMGAWLNPIGIVGNRPFVTSTLGRREREINFRDNAKQAAGTEWASLSRKQRNARVRAERSRWATENVGTLPAETTFTEFFSRAPASFQKNWLGPTRYRLYKKGGLEINSFVDLQTGKTYSIDQLAASHRPAFVKAGLI